MVANILALYLNLPFTDIDNFVNNGNLRTGTTRKCKNWIKEISEAKHVLIVDDSISSGKAIKEAKEILKEVNLDCKMTFLAVYALAVSCKKVDIYFELCEQPRMFEWNFMHHWALEYCCMDIDGVVCEDPTKFQNDDGSRYKEFLKNAAPKFIPTQKVGKFVSTRLEKYRYETEEWLKKYNIEYGELILMDGVTAKERALLGKHAEFKAKVYKQCDAILFFESDYDQALNICKLSGKPVFCIENQTMLTSHNIEQMLKVHNREFVVTFKRSVRKIMNKLYYV
jgi:uncharacterized HAD superfamily protein